MPTVEAVLARLADDDEVEPPAAELRDAVEVRPDKP